MSIYRSEQFKGEGNPNFGKRYTCKKISDKVRQRWNNKEWVGKELYNRKVILKNNYKRRGKTHSDKTERETKNCLLCDTKFTARKKENKIFCSRKCVDISLIKKIYKMCEGCGKNIFVLPQVKHCSMKCYIINNIGCKRPETRKKMRISHIKRIERNGGISVGMGKYETEILDFIEKQLNIKLERQYRCIGYFIDGYNEEHNLVIEVDEKAHYKDSKLIEKDIIRQSEIQKELGCNFIRIKDDYIKIIRGENGIGI